MKQIDNEKFGKFITELRKEKNLTQNELADQLFVSDKTVSKWERGASFPNVVLLRNCLCFRSNDDFCTMGVCLCQRITIFL